MDDLHGLDWSASANPKPAVKGTGNYYATLPPSTSSSGRATPIVPSLPQKSTPSQLKSSANDSFSNLVSFTSGKQTNNLTLAQQQAKLQAEKARHLEEQHKLYDAQFGFPRPAPQSTNVSSTANSTGQPLSFALNPPSSIQSSIAGSSHSYPLRPSTTTLSHSSDDDLFAAFNKDAKVDASSHFPPPSSSKIIVNDVIPRQAPRLDLNDPKAWSKTPVNTSDRTNNLADDDPFGLEQLASRMPTQATPQHVPVDDDNDFLGDLGKPVEEVRKKYNNQEGATSMSDIARQAPNHDPLDDPFDRAINDLVDMGFSAEDAGRALTEGGSGLDVQAAVSWLLNDAHRRSKEKVQSRSASQRSGTRQAEASPAPSRLGNSDSRRDEVVPPWMRASREHSQSRREHSRSPAVVEGDLTKTAAAVGSNLLKTANSLWKTSQKKVQQAVSEFHQETDPNQPKWMRSGNGERESEDPRTSRVEARSNQARQPDVPVTDEALMLEGDSRPISSVRKSVPSVINTNAALKSLTASRDNSPRVSAANSGRSTSIPRWQSPAPDDVSSTVSNARQRLNKETTEEQSTKLYVRRRKVETIPVETEDHDLLSGMSNATVSASKITPTSPAIPVTSARPAQSARPVTQKPQMSASVTSRLTMPVRDIPSASPAALASSRKHRLAGTEHFKRGDYAAAHASYSSSLTTLPGGHPVTIVLLCNRSLTSLKTGDPKQALTDADSALSVIGSGRGEGESIDLDGAKPMKEFFGKALTRKAEALEQMERWSDAKDVWQIAVEAGSGGLSAAQGRQRCEKALAPKPKAVPKAPVAIQPRRPPKPVKDSEAVTRLREANAATEKADDERFALSDSVDARIKAWRDGRQDNLRALLGGMDQVLWEGSGWKKVGMSDLVMNNKVKINYMKAIAKVHPDKVCRIMHFL